MFTNLKVLELASVLAGPSVGQFFAELGAEVIKVENLKTGGDITRTWKSAGENTDDRSAYFCSINWGKKSLALDLTIDAGRNVVHQIAMKSDIVITSYKQGDAEKLGVSYDQLKAKNPKLIYGQITGYGSGDSRVGYDAVLQAESGFMDLNGEKNGPPTKMPVALIDVLAGHQLKEGLLLALLNRERTGLGDFIQVSLMDAALSTLTNQASNWLVAKKLPTRQGSSHPNIAPYGESFETSDDKLILLAVGSDRQFMDLCYVLDINISSLPKSFSTNQGRVENRIELTSLLEAKFKNSVSNDILTQLHLKKIPAGIIQNVKEALEQDGIDNIFLKAQQFVGIKNFIASSQNLNSKFQSPILPPPHFGEHTEEILASLFS